MFKTEGPVEVHLQRATLTGAQMFVGTIDEWNSIGLTVTSKSGLTEFFPWVAVSHVRPRQANSVALMADGSIDWATEAARLDGTSGWF